MKKIKEFFQKKVVRIISIILIVVLVAFIAITVIRKKNTTSSTQDFTYVRTVTLGYGSLEETIVADGTIESQTTSTITSSVNGAKVSKINYSVGDYVKAGDTIIELDSSNLSKQITKAQENVTEQEERLQDTYDDAYDDLDEKEATLKSAKSALDIAKSAYDTANAYVSGFQSKYDTALSEFNKFVSTTSSDSEGYETKYKEYQDDVTKANTALTTAKKDTNYDSLYSAYSKAQSTYDQALSQYNSSEKAYDTAYDNLQDGVDTDSLDELNDTVSDYKLKAQTDGQITSINAVVGDSASGTLATIQDTGKLKISLTIDEYDILKLQLGMKAKIQTDASDTVYEGEVSMISPTATSSMGSSGFVIEVNVTSEDVSDLLIGMNAEVTIILSSTEENFTVPIDAVETKVDGTKVIYVQNEEGDFDELEVTTGEENGYYIEIFSDELEKGMIVRASANEEEAEVTISEDEISEDSDMFSNFGGMSGGGDMPSGGGGNMPSGGGGGNMPSGGGMPSGGRNGN